MTDQTTTIEELNIRRGRVAALQLAKAVQADDAATADRMYRYEAGEGRADVLNAGAISMLLAAATGFAAATGTTVEAILDYLIDTEAGAMITLAQIDQLDETTTTEEEQ